MAIIHVVAWPSGDIHLVLSIAARPFSLKVWGYSFDSSDPHFRTDVTEHAELSGLSDIVGFQNSPPFNLTPQKVGVTYGTIKCTIPGIKDPFFLPIRITVHFSIADFWLGTRTATLFQNYPDGYTLSVFARFNEDNNGTALTTGDITGHPYLDYNPANPAMLSVSPEGRMTGKQQGITSVTVTCVSFKQPNGQTDPITNIKIIDQIATPRPIVQRMRGSGEPGDKLNVLFLPEGFTHADRDKFTEWTEDIVDNWLNNPSNSPFQLLSGSINVWRVFDPNMDPSYQDGITIAPPVVRYKRDPDADPNDPDFCDMVDANSSSLSPDAEYLLTRNSYLGFCYGSRYGERWSYDETLSDPAKDWYIRSFQNRSARVDFRRRSLDEDSNTFLYNYLGTLQQDPNEKYRIDESSYSIGALFRENATKRFVVCVLINDDPIAGLSTAGRQLRKVISLAVTTGWSIQIEGAPSEPRPYIITHRPKGNQRDTNRTMAASVLSHEVGHYIGLGDEYGSIDYPKRTIYPPDLSQVPGKDVDLSANITTFRIVAVNPTDPRSHFDPKKIKWNWHRILMASVLTADIKVLQAQANSIAITVKGRLGRHWKKEDYVYLRTRALNLYRTTPVPANVPTAPFGPLQITAVNEHDDLVELTLDPSGLNIPTELDFPAGSTVYIPMGEDPKNPDTLIHPIVQKWIETHGPFKNPNRDCSFDLARSRELDIPDQEMVGFAFPINRAMIIGLYVGGENWNCNVYRPCGICKMRAGSPRPKDPEDPKDWFTPVWPENLLDEATNALQFYPFCFVCKYILVDAIDPMAHGTLNQHYPDEHLKSATDEPN